MNHLFSAVLSPTKATRGSESDTFGPLGLGAGGQAISGAESRYVGQIRRLVLFVHIIHRITKYQLECGTPVLDLDIFVDVYCHAKGVSSMDMHEISSGSS